MSSRTHRGAELPVSPRVRRLVTPLFDKIVYASTAYVELKSTVNHLAVGLVDLSGDPGGDADQRLREALGMVRPWTVPGARLTRVGGDGDGGYVMVDGEIATTVGAVSVGVGPDVSWDIDIAARGLPVALFDPTVRRLPAPVPGGTFHRVGLAGADVADDTYRPLSELVARSGFSPEAQLLLKIDVEGAEWPALSTLEPDELSSYRQIVLELHQLSRLADPATAAPVLASLQTLFRGHLPFHVHANNFSRLVRFDRYWFPDTIEISYLRRDLARDAHPAQRLATEFDVPCDPRVAELSLTGLLTLPADPDPTGLARPAAPAVPTSC